MSGSRYASEERVTWPGQGQWLPPDVIALIPGGVSNDGTAILEHDDGGFVVRGATDGSLALRTRSGSLWVFATVDNAIAAVIGPPYE